MADDGARAHDATRRPSWLAELFRSEHARMARFLRLQVRDADVAADLLQDAFARLSATAGAAPPRKPEAYLQRVIRNLVIDRKRRTRHEPDLLTLDACELPSVAPEQEQAITVGNLMKRYRAALDALTPRTRQVFLMHRVDDFTYGEIARRLGISVATVEYHMSRALVHLDEALGE